jgi:hypothetical protein
MRVGAVDDAERRLAARRQRQSGAHILRLRRLVLDRLPDAELGQRRLGVFPRRHGIDTGHREPPIAEQRREREAGRDRRHERRVLRRDQDQGIGKEIEAGRRLDQIAFGEIVHPAFIGRDENLSGRALLDLLGQRR